MEIRRGTIPNAPRLDERTNPILLWPRLSGASRDETPGERVSETVRWKAQSTHSGLAMIEMKKGG